MAKCVYEVNDRGIALLKINNPPMNALDEQTMLELEFSMRQVEVDDRVKVVIITGEGTTFVVGADVNKVRNVKRAEDGRRLTTRAHEIMDLIMNSRKPVIAAINGLCLGGGMELAMACHIRIAGDQAQMGLPEIMLGIMPGFGGTQRSARLLGAGKALEIMLTGKFIDMTEAKEIGLVGRVVPQSDIMNEAEKLAKQIASKGQLAVRAIVEAVIEGGRMTLREGLELESELFGRLAESEDKEEGINAFLEKRTPAFKDK
ncbi:MAG: enoyl-CoA hydratase [Spirochaetes bacterium]|nr:MAG: enoyl-CoA hydratase [Spirochaetota bacterium]